MDNYSERLDKLAEIFFHVVAGEDAVWNDQPEWIRERERKDTKQFMVDNGLAFIAENQELPKNPVSDWIDINPRFMWQNGQRDMVRAGFRRIVLEK
jgi:hypothetical protein